MSDRFGIWASPPGGWCSIRWDPMSSLAEGEEYFGTREEVEARLPIFTKSAPEGGYEIVPFDLTRDPIFTDGKPTDAQQRALALIGKYRSWNTWPLIPGATMTALLRKGWITNGGMGGQGCRLTAGGARLLAQSKVKT